MSIQELNDLRARMTACEREQFDAEFQKKWLELLDQLTYKEEYK